MEVFLKAAASAILVVILGLSLSEKAKDISVLLSLAGCVMIALAAMGVLQPVLGFFTSLRALGDLDGNLVEILLKAVGIGLISQLAGLICADSGNAALGKALQILAGAIVLWLSIPLFENLLSLIQKILGEI